MGELLRDAMVNFASVLVCRHSLFSLFSSAGRLQNVDRIIVQINDAGTGSRKVPNFRLRMSAVV